MGFISKYDKKIWDKYISNFENSVLRVNKKNMDNSEDRLLKSNLHKTHKLKNDSNISRKKGFKPGAKLDLHGYSLYTAKLILHKYLIDCYDKNIRSVLIITGKGQFNKGVLKEEVPKWLTEYVLKKFIIRYDIAPKNFGGEGALLIKIKNKFKKHI